jgi:glycine cleavage system H lipoate-binding protein
MVSKARRESMKIVPPGKKKCVWMEAGVVSYKLCDNNYDCPTCVYDRAMQSKVARQKEVSVPRTTEQAPDRLDATWVDKMMRLPASRRKCRYMITGEVDRKLCPNAYECGSCAFDQMMQARIQAEPIPVAAKSYEGGFELASEMYYHEGHAWAKPEYGGRVRVGLDDFAQKLLGHLTSIETPDVGHEVKQGQVAFQLKRNDEAVRLRSPIDGVIARLNHRLREDPSLINDSPYQHGWLFIVEPTRLRKNLKALYYGEEAQQFISHEKEKLFSMAHKDLNIAADGGLSVEDISSELGGENWAEFVRVFLRT